MLGAEEASAPPASAAQIVEAQLRGAREAPVAVEEVEDSPAAEEAAEAEVEAAAVDKHE